MAQRSSAFQPAGAGLRNSIRFQWRNEEGELMERYDFVKQVLLNVLKVDPESLWCLQKNMAAKSFDLTCMSAVGYEGLLDRCKEKAEEEPLAGFAVSSLVCKSFKIVTVHMYNPYVGDEAIGGFLGRYGSVLPGVRYLRDSFGIWTGKRQFRVILREDPKGYDGLCHPPAHFSLGADRGFLYYSEQPVFCRMCQSFGHMAANCGNVRCRNCKEEGHMSSKCPSPKKCHSCGSKEHLFRDCSGAGRTYAEAAGSSGAGGGGPASRAGAAAEEERTEVPRREEEPQREKEAEKEAQMTEGQEKEVPEAEPVVAEAEGEAQDLEGDSEEMELGVGRSLKGRRVHDNESAGPGDASSGEGGGHERLAKKKKKKSGRRAEDSQGTQASAWGSSGLPPSGTVAVSNRFSGLQQDEEGEAGPTGSGPGDIGDRTGKGGEGGKGRGGLLGDSSESEEHNFDPPSSPNTAEFLSMDEGDFETK